MNLTRGPITVPAIQNSHPIHMWSFAMLVLSWILFELTASLLYYILRRKRSNILENL
jgi:hypothetical protein